MSIRWRLTLVYAGVFSLTLFFLGIIVRGVQSYVTWGAIRSALLARAQMALNAPHIRRGSLPPVLVTPATQTRNPDGDVLARSPDLGETVLPLSARGLREVQSGKVWHEVTLLGGERWLVRSEPVLAEGRIIGIMQVGQSLAERDRALLFLQRNLVIGGLAAMLLGAGCSWWLAGLALRPIRRLTQTAATIGQERDFTRRVVYSGPNDEVGQLATTFNTMLGQLGAAYAQVERSLEEQRRFIAEVSHELRTPLTTLRGNLALLRRDPPLPSEEARAVLGDMAEETERLIRLVNDLLALARAEAKRPEAHRPVAVEGLLQEVCRQARALAPEREILCMPCPELAVLADPDALKQVLLILLDNALKYTSGVITVTAQESADQRSGARQVALSVQDAGPGMEPQVLARIFERFYRGEQARSQPGVGLGLPIAQTLVEASGGTITVTSDPAQGSTFTILVPAA
jgi:two-component system OmpR family sensor kinase